MSLDIKVHDAQTAILRELLFHPHAGFAQMQKPTGLASDHFNFHIARLVELGLVHKITRGQYALTHKGKEYANKMDTDNNTIERQPKVAVLLILEREDGKVLAQQRLKQPYYGYWGRATGKIRWGETILQAAERELMEETGLTADLEFKAIYHKMDYNQESGDMLEDKLFFVMHGVNPRGELIEEFEGGRNAWMSQDEVKAQDKVFDGIDKSLQMARGAGPLLVEQAHHYLPADY
jgi:8-oxo-dGTP pyrophosphatase MutT (NUDIX family)